MSRVLRVPEHCSDLPAGYRYGARAGSRPGQGGCYYLIRVSDDAACFAEESPEIDDAPTADEIDACIDVTDRDLRALMAEAQDHGDDAQSVLCARALDGDATARAKCEAVIRGVA